MTNMDIQSTDQRIDQLLQALGNIETPSRLEERVAERVARHSATARRRSSRRFFFAAWPVTALAVLILTVAFLHSHRKPATIAQLPQSSATKPQLLMQARAPEPNHPATHTAPSQHHALEAVPAATEASIDPDTIALAETLAPSHPAPPLPLSQQERLMLTILRSGEQEEIAALIPAERDALFARDQAAFNEYFALKDQPSNTGDQK